MFKLNNFYNQTYSFSKTLIIKNHQVASIMETKVRTDMFNPEDTEDMKNWKYYLNLNGEKHPSDKDVIIKVLETDTEEVLTKELLQFYKITTNELLKCGYYYKNLIESNKDMFLYIHGCLYPIDIDKTIEAIDGTIMSYNHTLLEENEVNILPELQKFIYNFHYSWFNRAYTITDPLYLPTFLASLYATIPNVLVNLRLLNTKTNRTHSFFLESYFNSRFYLWDSISKLNKETIWWLYRHIDYIIKNIGKNSTFQLLLDKVFEPNNIGIGGYNLEYMKYELNKDFFNPYKLPYSTGGSIMNKVKLNESFLISKEGDNVNVDSILIDQLANTEHSTDRKSFLKNSYVEEVNAKVNVSSITKILELSSLKTFNLGTLDTYSILLDYWGYLLSIDLYGSFLDPNATPIKLEFRDPNTEDSLSINSKTGFYILIKLLLRAINKEDLPLQNFVFSRVFNPNFNIEEMFDRTLYKDGYTKTLKDTLLKNYPIINQAFTSNIVVGEFLGDVIKYYKQLWLLDANAENPIVSSNLKYFLFLAQLNNKYKIHPYDSPVTIDTLLQREGVMLRFTEDYDISKSVKELFRSCLGVDLRTTEKVTSLIEYYKNIIHNLTSYTLQTYGSYNHEERVGINYNNIGILFTKRGIVNLFPGRVEGESLDKTFATSSFLTYDPSESPKKYYTMDSPAIHVCDTKHLKGSYITLEDSPITTHTLTFKERINGVEEEIGVYVNPIIELHSIKIDPFMACDYTQSTLELLDNTLEETKDINVIPAFFTPLIDVTALSYSILPPKISVTTDTTLDLYGVDVEDKVNLNLPIIGLE